MRGKFLNSPGFARTERCIAIDFKMMDTKTLSRMLFDCIQELERQGIVDHYFRDSYSLKEFSGVSFFLDLVCTFLNDVYGALTDMAKTMSQPVVNSDEMHSHYIKLKGGSSCFGACQIRDACSILSDAIEKNSRDEYIQALNVIQYEYKSLLDQLDNIIKIEMEIVARDTIPNK